MSRHRDLKLIRSEMEQTAAEATGFLPDLNSDDDAKVTEARSKHTRAMDVFDTLQTELDAATAEDKIEADRLERHDKMRDFLRTPTNQPGAPSVEDARDVADGKDPKQVRAFRDWVCNGREMSDESKQILRDDLQRRETNRFRGEGREERALSTGTSTAGGYLIPEELYSQIDIQMLAEGPMMNPDYVRNINTDAGGELNVPTLNDTANTVVLLSEGVAPAVNKDPVFGNVSLTAYKYATTMVLISYELLMDSAFDLSQLLDDIFAARMARGMNAIFTTADGSSKPQGVLVGATEGLAATGSATAFGPNDFTKLFFSVDAAYRNRPKCRWQMADSSLQKAREMTVSDTDRRPLWQTEGLTHGNPATFMGKPYSVNPALPAFATGAESVLFGDHNEFVTRRSGPYRLRRSDEHAFDTDQIAFIGVARWDSAILQTVAVKHLTIK